MPSMFLVRKLFTFIDSQLEIIVKFFPAGGQFYLKKEMGRVGAER